MYYNHGLMQPASGANCTKRDIMLIIAFLEFVAQSSLSIVFENMLKWKNENLKICKHAEDFL